jgi:phosphoglucosamine mutase
VTAEVALAVGKALAYLINAGRLGRGPVAAGGTLLPTDVKHRGRVVIGKDTRASGYMIEQALCAGLTSMGVDVLLTGPLPTPGIAYITSSMRADAGLVVSASHNPFADNGIKVFGHDGFKLDDDIEAALEALILDGVPADAAKSVTGNHIGRAARIDDAQGRYVVHVKRSFPESLSLEGLRLVVDSAHGAGYCVAPDVFRELGATVFELGASPNGTNINDGVGSLHPQSLQDAVRRERAHAGIALDGDADRVIIVDDRGDIVDGDAVMAICAREMHKQGKLRGATLVSTVMSNMGLERCLKPLGIRVERVQVGDRAVVEKMRQNGGNLGGEQSGHIVFLDHSTTGDGCVAALGVLASMLRDGRPLSEVAAMFVKSPQELVNVKVASKKPFAEMPTVQAAITDAEQAVGETGRVLVRYSGTELKARVMIEGDDALLIKRHAQTIADALQKALS